MVEIDLWLKENKKKILVIIILFFIISIAVNIRIKNLPYLVDTTTGKYIPIEADGLTFIRYAEHILEHGALMGNDVLRYVPYGYDPLPEFNFLASFLAYSYKIISVFYQGSFDYWATIYPIVMFAIFIIVFFFLTKELFDTKISLLATASVAVLPVLLERTTAGFTDKEPLAMITMALSFLLYVLSWKSKTNQISIILGVLAGLTTAITGAIWGGVQFIYIIIGLTTLIFILLEKYSIKDLLTYSSWFITLIITSIFLVQTRATLMDILTTVTAIPMTFTFAVGIIDYLIKKYETPSIKKIYENKIPRPIVSITITAIVLSLIVLFIRGPYFFYGSSKQLYQYLTQPEGVGRWGLTVQESQPTYTTLWLFKFGPRYFFLVLIGVIILLYEGVKGIAEKKKIIIAFTIFFISFIFHKYSSESILNGINPISKIFYLGGILALISIYIYVYFSKYLKERNLSGLKVNRTSIFMILWFLISIAAAKSKIRLLIILAIVSAPLFAFAIFYIYKKLTEIDIPINVFGFKITPKNIKIFTIIILAFLLFSPFGTLAQKTPIINKIPVIKDDGLLISHYKTSSAISYIFKPTIDPKEQTIMKWIRENTNRNAVFASWWDYGYWIQTLGERGTISDGGNARGAINYFTGRYLITSNNDTETLEFLYANNVTHIVVFGQDLFKYPVISLIGSNVDYDRYSWIIGLIKNPTRTRKEGEITYMYYIIGKEIVLDDNLIYEDKKYKMQEGKVLEIVIPTKENNGKVVILQPLAFITDKYQKSVVPIECVIHKGKEIIFPKKGLDACIVLKPFILQNYQDEIGSAMLIQKKARYSFFTRYYVKGESNKNFELVYSDDQGIPFAQVEMGGIIPNRIWKVNYPKDIKDNPFYRQTILPDEMVYYIDTKKVKLVW